LFLPLAPERIIIKVPFGFDPTFSFAPFWVGFLVLFDYLPSQQCLQLFLLLRIGLLNARLHPAFYSSGQVAKYANQHPSIPKIVPV